MATYRIIRRISLLAAILILLLTGCAKETQPPQASEQPNKAETKSEEKPTQEQPLSAMIAAATALPGWEPSGTPQSAEGDDLFVLINGGAEVYLEYGFKSATLANFKDAGGNAIIAEVYEMTSNDAAYGIFSHKTDKDSKPVAIGDEARQSGYYINAWRGNYLITITSGDPSKDIGTSLTDAARAMAATVQTKATKPELITKLEKAFTGKEGPRELKYLKGPTAAAATGFAGVGKVRIEEGAALSFGDLRAFVIKYGGPGPAKEQFERAATAASEDGPKNGFHRVSDHFTFDDSAGNHALFYKNGELIIVVQTKDKANTIDRVKSIRNALAGLSDLQK